MKLSLNDKLRDSNIVETEFDPRSVFCINFRNNTFKESVNLIMPSAMGKILPLLFFYKKDFDIA